MELAIIIGQLLLKFEPEIVALYVSLANRKDPPTTADWDAFFARISKTGDSYFLKPVV